MTWRDYAAIAAAIVSVPLLLLVGFDVIPWPVGIVAGLAAGLAFAYMGAPS